MRPETNRMGTDMEIWNPKLVKSKRYVETRFQWVEQFNLLLMCFPFLPPWYMRNKCNGRNVFVYVVQAKVIEFANTLDNINIHWNISEHVFLKSIAFRHSPENFEEKLLRLGRNM